MATLTQRLTCLEEGHRLAFTFDCGSWMWIECKRCGKEYGGFPQDKKLCDAIRYINKVAPNYKLKERTKL